MTFVLAIDPGPSESAYALVDAATCEPLDVDKLDNRELLDGINGSLPDGATSVAVEMVASYGMAVGAEVFDTCVWIGRFVEALLQHHGVDAALVFRRDVKLHHCGVTKAKDANIVQALIDRFAAGVPNRGKGTKSAPGWFFGFRADIWQAYALAVLVADRVHGRPGVSTGGAS